MKISNRVSTILSFVLLGLILLAYIVTNIPNKNPIQPIVPKLQNQIMMTSFNNNLFIGGIHLDVAFARSAVEQTNGLSNTKGLEATQGMLFMFPTISRMPFWMKDMNYPIDIIWIGEDKRVKDITKNLSPDTYPETVSPKEAVQYVLEVQAGFVEKNNIKIGTVVSF